MKTKEGDMGENTIVFYVNIHLIKAYSVVFHTFFLHMYCSIKDISV